MFIALYLFVLINYFFSETSGNFKRRVINKVLLASMFLAYGGASFIMHYDPMSFHLLLMIGIIFSWLGDVVLLRSFTRGGVLFMIGNCFIIIYEIALARELSLGMTDLWPAGIVFTAFWGTMAFMVFRKHIDFGNRTPIILLYLCSVTVHGSLGLALMRAYPAARIMLLGVGLALFMISDYFLLTYTFKFRNSKTILRCNSGTYFIGLMLVVLGMSF